MIRRSFDPVAVYGKIGRFAGRGLMSGRVGELKSLGSVVEEQQQ
jgi:hypothetical protein